MLSVKTLCLLPNPVLSPFIKHYAVRIFDTGQQEMPKPMLADHEITMAFFLRCRIHDFRPLDHSAPVYSLNKRSEADCYFIGPQTLSKGFVIFKGEITLINIHFKPAGFINIFNISPREIKDCIGNTEDILSREVHLLQEQLHEGEYISECIQILEKFLVKKLLSHKFKYRHLSIQKASDYLIKEKGLFPIKELAHHSNMTIQTFEVQFVEQIGMSPKLYARLIRFGWAVELKLYQPAKSWTEIAHICGYYDQNHFVKEFKEFTLLSPNKFLKTMHPIVEDFEFE